MNCETFEELITAHLDGELAGVEVSDFREHQLACASCRALLEDVSAAIVACTALPSTDRSVALLGLMLLALAGVLGVRRLLPINGR